jgi:hypothetical protein
MRFFFVTEHSCSLGGVDMKKHLEKFHESLSSIGVSLEALLGSLLTALAVAVILRIASGKW